MRARRAGHRLVPTSAIPQLARLGRTLCQWRSHVLARFDLRQTSNGGFEAVNQVDVVRQHLNGDVPIHGVLCFIEADWPLLGGTFTTNGVQALWPKKLYQRLQAQGPLTEQTISEIHRQLGHALPVA